VQARSARSEPQASEGGCRAAQPRVPLVQASVEIYTRSLDCVHCGLCLPTCPTYRETGRETSSPRGRIYLMRGVAEGKIPLAGTVAEEMYLCLGCRACETACPSGVQFGTLLEDMRAEVERRGLRRGPAKWLESLALRGVLPHARRLRTLVSLLGFAQRLGLDRLALRLAPARLRERAALAPRVPSLADRQPLPSLVPAVGERRGRVGFFVGCIMPELFGDVNHATVRVLARNGFDVIVAAGQGCCGALHAHAGDADTAHVLARRNVAAFEAAGVDVVVVNSAGCGAALREVGHWLPETGELLAKKIRDVSEFLDAAGLRPPPGRVEVRVCYDDPCHLVHGQRVQDAPRRLLAQIPGVVLVPHDDPTACCGAAGIYNLTHPEMSQAVLERKMAALAAADPDVIATGNPGCMMQIRAGVSKHGLRAQVLHPVELLDRAYGGGARSGRAPYL
jgi:glycolate oxidase iron-sulfur subunit